MGSRNWALSARRSLALALVAGGCSVAQAQVMNGAPSQDAASTRTIGALNATLPKVGGLTGPGVALALQINLANPASIFVVTPAVPVPAPAIHLNGDSSFGIGSDLARSSAVGSASGYVAGLSRGAQDNSGAGLRQAGAQQEAAAFSLAATVVAKGPASVFVCN